MEFNSKICTTIEQSKRLMELGLKKETADMLIMSYSTKQDIIALPWSESGGWTKDNSIPAWSLHRLIEMLPSSIRGLVMTCDLDAVHMTCYLEIVQNAIAYYYYDTDGSYEYYEVFFGDMYSNVINMIEFLISEGKLCSDLLNE